MEIARELGIDHKTVLNHLHKAGSKKEARLGSSRIKNMMDRINICHTLLKRNEIESFLKRMITGDEKWITYDNRIRKRSWIKKGEKKAQAIAKPGLTTKKLCVVGLYNFDIVPSDYHLFRFFDRKPQKFYRDGIMALPPKAIAEGLPGTRTAYFWEPLWPVGCGRQSFPPGVVGETAPGDARALTARFGLWGGDTTPASATPVVVGGRELRIPAPVEIPSLPRGANLESLAPLIPWRRETSSPPRVAMQKPRPRHAVVATRGAAAQQPRAQGGSSVVRRRCDPGVGSSPPHHCVCDAGPSVMAGMEGPLTPSPPCSPSVMAGMEGPLTPSTPCSSSSSSSSVASNIGEGGRRRSRPVGRSLRRVRASSDPERERSGCSRRPRYPPTPSRASPPPSSPPPPGGGGGGPRPPGARSLRLSASSFCDITRSQKEENAFQALSPPTIALTTAGI
ncbi:SETMR methyltransferase, partial [Acromyrmex heyeri]